MSNDKYIKGIFIQEFDGKYGDFLSFGLTDEGIEMLKRLPKNERGVRNFAAFRQKNDKAKYSAHWPKNAQAPTGQTTRPVNNNPLRQVNEYDDMPF